MEDRYSLKKDAFDFFMDGTYQDLKNEIAKSKVYILNARKYPHKYPSQSRSYALQYNRWKALELLEQLKSNTITREVFDSKVIVDKGIPGD
jgi:hypothetical protein